MFELIFKRLISYENAKSPDFLRILIDKYFFIENDGHKLPEAEGLLILKGDFVRKKSFPGSLNNF